MTKQFSKWHKKVKSLLNLLEKVEVTEKKQSTSYDKRTCSTLMITRTISMDMCYSNRDVLFYDFLRSGGT